MIIFYKKKLNEILLSNSFSNMLLNNVNYDLNLTMDMLVKIYKYINDTRNFDIFSSGDIFSVLNNYKPKNLYLSVDIPIEVSNYYKARINNKLKFKDNDYYYTSYDNILINKDFKYRGNKVSGKIDEDYSKLINDERNNEVSSRYDVNIDNIKNNDNLIWLKRDINEYEIIDGRHRLTYIINSGNEEVITVKVEKKFDKESNSLLNILKNKYKALIIKNDILNEDLNLLIIINNKLYEIKGKDDLISFINNSSGYYINEIDMNLDTKLYSNYIEMINNKYRDSLDILFNTDLSQILNEFNIYNYTFIKAYEICRENYVMNLKKSELKCIDYNKINAGF